MRERSFTGGACFGARKLSADKEQTAANGDVFQADISFHFLEAGLLFFPLLLLSLFRFSVPKACRCIASGYGRFQL